MSKYIPSIVLSLAIVLLCAVPLKAQQQGYDWEVPASRENFHIFLLMGQSNMAGAAPLEKGDEKPVPHVLEIPTVCKDGFAWKPAAHPLHNRLSSDRFGPGLPFAIEYLKSHPNVTVGLIPVAWGGAGIDRLDKGSPTYKDAIEKARWASRQGILKAVLWHQGESDSVTQRLADSYSGKLDQLVADLRNDLHDPTLPFIVGDLAPFYGTGPEHNAPDRVRSINQIRQALRDLPRHLAQTAFVETTRLQSLDGHMVHFDRASYIELGRRYAHTFAKLQMQTSNTPK